MIASQLSSDILEAQFGPTTIDILRQDGAIRVTQTVAAKTGQVLELSLVRFLPEGAAASPEVHQAVLSGQSMGKAFRTAGIAFKCQTTFACRHVMPPALQQRFQSAEPATVTAVRILVGPHETPYAVITEAYAPAVNWPHLSGDITSTAKEDLGLLATTLASHQK